MLTLLAIESSCDDTGAAVFRNGQLLSNVVADQAVHEQYGGVVPELASRDHIRRVLPLTERVLADAGMALAGLDGIENRIHPGPAMDKNLYDLPPAELANVPTVCASLREALESLQADHEFLLRGDVFTKDQIDSYIELKYADVARWEMTPSAVEFDMYYSS